MLERFLARFFREGDVAAMGAVVRRTRGRLLSIARRIGAPQDAEDSVQAAYYALLRHGAFRGPVTVEAWLTTAVVRIAYRQKALARRELHLAERLAREGPGVDPHAAVARREEIALVRRAVARLPAKYRDVLVLRYLEGLSVAETERLLDVRAATVKTRTRRGLGLLKARIAPWAAWPLLAIPWLAADGVAHATRWGIAMNIKATATMAGVALAAAAVGVGVGMGVAAPDRPERSERTPREATHATASMEAELARWRRRAGDAEHDLAELRASKTGSEAERKPEERASAFDVRYAAAGKELGVSSAALAAAKRAKSAYDAWRLGRSSRVQKELNDAVKALEAFGGEAFLATVAHLRATEAPEGQYVFLLSKTWKEGLETHLLSLARNPEATLEQRRHALLGLSATDTPRVREHLLHELQGAGDEELVFASAQALGWLHEERAVPVLERLLSEPVGAEHVRFLQALGSLGSEQAKRVLLDYCDRDHPGLYLVSGVKVLSWVDKEAARDAAARILDRPHAQKLQANWRRTLEAVAKR